MIWTLVLSSTAFILLIIVWKYKIKRYKEFWKYIFEIPGPKEYPIIGNFFEIVNSAEDTFLKDRERGKLYYPIYKLWSFNVAAVCILSPDDIELVLASMKHIKKSQTYEFLEEWLGTGLLTSAGSKWQYHRKLLTPAFHFSILQEFIGTFNRETEKLVRALEKVCSKSYIDVLEPITEYTLTAIGETSLGVNVNTQKLSTSYKKALYEFGESLAHRIVRPWLHDKNVYNFTPYHKSVAKNIKIMHEFSNSIIKGKEKSFKNEEKTSNPSKKRLAMLDLLLTAKSEGANLDDVDIREEVDTFMFEGHDTTSMAICYSLMALANEKSIQEEILQEIKEVLGDSGKAPTYSELMEMKFMERCVKECLRLYPSVPFIARIAGEDIKTASGYTIPKGANIHMHIYDLHRSPAIWDNPEKFDPDRFLPENIALRHPFAYIPFSAGPRNCIGQRYAILEIKAALCGILRKFKLEPDHTPKTCRYKSDLVLRPLNDLRVKFVLRE